MSISFLSCFKASITTKKMALKRERNTEKLKVARLTGSSESRKEPSKIQPCLYPACTDLMFFSTILCFIIYM